MRIAFATSSDHPELTGDDRLAAEALRARGAEVVPAIWNDVNEDWPAFDLVVIRSTWDYHTKYTEFLAWLDALDAGGVRVANDTKTLRWNADKRYLKHFEERDVNVIPTAFVDCGATDELIEILRGNRWHEAVVKPVVSATAYKTWRTTLATARDDQQKFEKLVSAAGVMVQPFVAEIETEGEWSFQFFGGAFSHAVVKRAQPGEYRVQEEYGGSIEPAVPPDHLLSEATRYILESPSTPDYARVDAVSVGGSLMLMELELIEPDLHFKYDENAPARFAERVMRVASATG